MSESPWDNWSLPQRQPIGGLVIIVLRALRTMLKILWPLLLIVIFRDSKRTTDPFESLLIILPVLILVNSLITFFYFRFYIENDNLIIKKGFLKKKYISLPLSRIQAVHIEQNFLQQWLAIVKIRIDTAGTEKTEAVIDAISIDKAEQLKSFLLPGETNPGKEETIAQASTEIPVISLSFMDLIKLGISANHVQTFFIVLAFAISFLQNLEEIFGTRLVDFVTNSYYSFRYSINAFLIIFILVLLMSVFVSFLRILLTYFNFSLIESSNGFKIKTGLLNVRENIIPFSKIQYLSWQATYIGRKVGLYNLQFHQAHSEDAGKKQRLKVPVTQERYLKELLPFYQDDLSGSAHSVHKMHRSYAFRRWLLVGLPSALAVTGLLYLWLQSYSLYFLLWIPYSYFSAWIYQKRFRLFVVPEALQIGSGVFGRKVEIIRWYKIQQVQLSQSMYQRSKQLANIKLKTAGGTIRIPFISLELARLIQNYALYKIESAKESWM